MKIERKYEINPFYNGNSFERTCQECNSRKYMRPIENFWALECPDCGDTLYGEQVISGMAKTEKYWYKYRL